MDYIKVVIKSKKHTALQKIYALRLLHKCIEAKCNDFNRYVDKKVLKRLLILAEFNKEKNKPCFADLQTKGELIFGKEDLINKADAARFLGLLLDCIEKWAQIVPLGEDSKSPSMYVKGYKSLVAKKVLFPS